MIAVVFGLLGMSLMLGSYSFGQGFFQQNTKYNPSVPLASGGITLSGAASLSGAAGSVLGAVKGAINRALSFLALIALILLIYAGFRMLLANGDEKKFEAGYTTLKQVATALIFIGVSWLLVSGIFWIISVITGP